MTEKERDRVRREFRELVNMPRRELERWLATEESRSVGSTSRGRAKAEATGPESVGHAAGRRIVEVLRTRVGDLDEDDYAHMRKVCAVVRRHLSQRPDGDVTYSRWRFSLMNWGHDPLR